MVKTRDFSILSPVFNPELSAKHFDNIPSSDFKPNLNSFSDLEYDKNKEEFQTNFSVSVVIPTNSGKTVLESLIKKIKIQKGIQECEIILINSGIHDLESLKKIPKVEIITIKPSEFNHGKTRNLGAKKAIGDYIIFLTDDAIPISDKLFYFLCNEISKDNKIAASTTIQIVKSDSDLMSQYSGHQYYKFLGLETDRITKCENFNALNSNEIRQICQIDNVCSCYKKDIFLKYLFKEIQFAEDLDLGIRFVKDGYKIAQLSSTGVIHSHTRNPMYYFKRSFVERITLENLLNYDMPIFSNFEIYSINDFIKNMFATYNSLCFAIEYLNKNPNLDISKTFKIINEKIFEHHSQNSTAKSNDSSFEDFFNNISFDNSSKLIKNNFILLPYLSSLTLFEEYLKGRFSNLENIDVDFYQTLYKIFGTVIGSNLGSFMIYAEKNNIETMENLQSIRKIMLGNV